MLGEMPEHPLHVKVVDTQNENVAAEFTSLMTYQVLLAGTAVPVQICPHRYHRTKAKFVVNMSADTVLYVATKPDPISGPVPSPVAFAFPEAAGFRLPDYEGQQPLYAVFTGPGPCTVAVWDSSYGTVQ
jgi:hypothetical protein